MGEFTGLSLVMISSHRLVICSLRLYRDTFEGIAGTMF
jgi:hypothetical protein